METHADIVARIVAYAQGPDYRPVCVARPPMPDSPDAMRLDASCAEADAELAEWRALLDAAKGRK